MNYEGFFLLFPLLINFENYQYIFKLLILLPVFSVPLHKDDTIRNKMYPPQYGTKDHNILCNNGELVLIYELEK